MKCPYGNNRCMCQTCEASWLNCGESRCIDCIECDINKKAVHDIYVCTGYKKVLPRACDTCRHHLGGGCCRINLEAECGKGEFEAWEPKEGSKDHGTYTPADHGGKGAAAPGHD